MKHELKFITTYDENITNEQKLKLLNYKINSLINTLALFNRLTFVNFDKLDKLKVNLDNFKEEYSFLKDSITGMILDLKLLKKTLNYILSEASLKEENMVYESLFKEYQDIFQDEKILQEKIRKEKQYDKSHRDNEFNSKEETLSYNHLNEKISRTKKNRKNLQYHEKIRDKLETKKQEITNNYGAGCNQILKEMEELKKRKLKLAEEANIIKAKVNFDKILESKLNKQLFDFFNKKHLVSDDHFKSDKSIHLVDIYLNLNIIEMMFISKFEFSFAHFNHLKNITLKIYLRFIKQLYAIFLIIPKNYIFSHNNSLEKSKLYLKEEIITDEYFINIDALNILKLTLFTLSNYQIVQSFKMSQNLSGNLNSNQNSSKLSLTIIENFISKKLYSSINLNMNLIFFYQFSNFYNEKLYKKIDDQLSNSFILPKLILPIKMDDIEFISFFNKLLNDIIPAEINNLNKKNNYSKNCDHIKHLEYLKILCTAFFSERINYEGRDITDKNEIQKKAFTLIYQKIKYLKDDFNHFYSNEFISYLNWFIKITAELEQFTKDVKDKILDNICKIKENTEIINLIYLEHLKYCFSFKFQSIFANLLPKELGYYLVENKNYLDKLEDFSENYYYNMFEHMNQIILEHIMNKDSLK
ncbi:MAG: hypothetical protein U1E31_02670, partial [Rickettsiales bacterium]